MGARLLKRWIGQPLLDLDALASPARCRRLVRERRPTAGQKVRDGAQADRRPRAPREPVVTGTATPRDLATLRDSLGAMPAIHRRSTGCRALPPVPDVGDARGRCSTRRWSRSRRRSLGQGRRVPARVCHRAGRPPRARQGGTGVDRQPRTHRAGQHRHPHAQGRLQPGLRLLPRITAAALASAERDRLARGEDGTALPVEYIPKQIAGQRHPLLHAPAQGIRDARAHGGGHPGRRWRRISSARSCCGSPTTPRTCAPRGGDRLRRCHQRPGRCRGRTQLCPAEL